MASNKKDTELDSMSLQYIFVKYYYPYFSLQAEHLYTHSFKKSQGPSMNLSIRKKTQYFFYLLKIVTTFTKKWSVVSQSSNNLLQ